MNDLFLFNSPPRCGNVFSTFLFSLFIHGNTRKCTDVEKYSDKTQKQAAFFRNPYDSLPSYVLKARVDVGAPIDKNNPADLVNNIEVFAKQYLDTIKQAKANQSNIYIGKSEDLMADPIGTIKDIALFFNIKIQNNHFSDNDELIKEIRNRMNNTERTRVDQHGQTIVETLMSIHDGHMPREKTEDRIFLDNLIQETDSNIVTQCYNEYISIKSTNAKEGKRWEY
jgi:hypothetical protein